MGYLEGGHVDRGSPGSPRHTSWRTGDESSTSLDDGSETTAMKKRSKFGAYHELPSTFQSPTARRPVNKSEWTRCSQCGKDTPSQLEFVRGADGALSKQSTCTFVCAHCRYSEVGK